MKNLKYFPFERNRYFYGKLLTVDDFETEQKYVNDKRRMINRFLHGCGVVCGMNVVRTDETTISVEMGLALDFAGREIVIDAPFIKKLSMIEGFDTDGDEQDDAGYYYLCIDYSETEKEAVHSIANNDASQSGGEEYNKYAEGYRIYLTSQEPESESFRLEQFYTDTRTVYWGHGVRIQQVTPRFVNTGSEFELTLIVENMGQQQPVSFSYDLRLTCVQAGEARTLHIDFNEKNFERAKRYEVSYRLRAMAVEDERGMLEVTPDSFRLNIGERQAAASTACANEFTVVAGNAKREVMRQYYRTAMEQIVKTTYQQSIYLAKIAVIKAGSTYVIEEIEQMPFGQCVFNNSLAAAINEMEIAELDALHGRETAAPVQAQVQPGATAPVAAPVIATGAAIIDLNIGGLEEQRFLTPNITHGLGLGPVTIILGQAYSAEDDSDVLFGPAGVFGEAEARGIPPVALAAKASPSTGTFVIGARTLAATNVRKLRVQWTAIRDPKQNEKDSHAKRIYIKPDVTDLGVRESLYFEAVLQNVSDLRVKWSVKEAEGGVITANGMYTAPNLPGVYEIICESAAYPELRASTFVVVRETSK